MSYTALYRKWRPQTFKDVLGQDHIVKTLKNQIISDRITHAYLFCGTRGTGKTSTAKIFAKTVNCENPVDLVPCGICSACSEQTHGTSLNIIEIDAASNNGVDNIRELREEVRYTPTTGKYKIYIIDEVHMLSTGAFNALLKTLEEPPAHIIFILATTDPQKIPTTILSRCQRFDFRRITVSEIAERLSYYMSCEKIAVDTNALSYIAKLADGSMRDALSILDQCVSFYFGENITLDKVLEITGSVDNEVLLELISACNDMNTQACLDIIDKIIMNGRDVLQLVNDLIGHCRNLLISKITSDVSSILDSSTDFILHIKEQAKNIPQENLIHYVHVFSELTSSLKYVQNPRLLLEITLIKITRPANDQSYDGLLQRIKRLEKDISKGVQNTSSVQTVHNQKPLTEKKDIPKAVDSDILKIIDTWTSLKDSFNLSPAINSLLNETYVDTLNDNKLYIICDNYVSKTLIQKKLDIISGALNDKFNKQFNIEIIEKRNYEFKYNNLHGVNSDNQNDDEFEYYKNILPDIEIY